MPTSCRLAFVMLLQKKKNGFENYVNYMHLKYEN